MDKNVVFMGLFAVLIGGTFGFVPFNEVFAQNDNLSVSREDSEAYKKQQESSEKEKQKAEERKQKLEEKQEKQKQKAEERKQKLEEKKEKLNEDRKKIEEKLAKKIQKYEDKLRELKARTQNRISSDALGDVENFSSSESKLEEKLAKKSEKIREKLEQKLEKLDTRTQKILEKIERGNYLGDKIGTDTVSENYHLAFDSVDATSIGDQTTTSLSGSMVFSTFDKKNSNLKLKLDECQITVDSVPYNCGFGKARSTSSDSSGSKDSLVIIAFLEDDVLEEVHSTLKLLVNADIPISDIDESTQVSILSPQSKISHMWFLDGSATLSKTIVDEPTTDEITDEIPDEIPVGKAISIELTETLGLKN
ncbi:hypothetical protein [Nitrosopumilus sp.]|uniref:hypothetical protein n=1 Tax=Nitrosopumilus sp. TaxID=2024843 RepID=UPI00260D58F9|nr:hypothetical protein [Nitrosopumilus sp.]